MTSVPLIGCLLARAHDYNRPDRPPKTPVHQQPSDKASQQPSFSRSTTVTYMYSPRPSVRDSLHSNGIWHAVDILSVCLSHLWESPYHNTFWSFWLQWFSETRSRCEHAVRSRLCQSSRTWWNNPEILAEKPMPILSVSLFELFFCGFDATNFLASKINATVNKSVWCFNFSSGNVI